LQVWDTSGQERFQGLGTCFYRGTDIVILAYAINNLKSFERISFWYEEYEEMTKEGTPPDELW